MRRGVVAGCAMAVWVLACWSAPALAERGELADFSEGFTTEAPGVPTGLTIRVRFHQAGDPNAKPAPLRSAVIHGPPGLRFDTSTVEACRASDDEIRALGSDACPAESRLALGSFSAMTGLGPPFDPIAGDDHLFNGDRQLIEIITVPGGSASPVSDRLTISGATLTAHPPRAPGGPPDGESSVRSIEFGIRPRAAAGKSLITTPPICPASGQWVTIATFGFGDGRSETIASRARCARGHSVPRTGRPRLRLAVRPRRALVGERVRLHLIVRSRTPGCVAQATVRVGTRRVRTDRNGRARPVVRFERAGRRAVRATHRGCRAASAAIRVAKPR
jgi:hypothetical protein